MDLSGINFRSIAESQNFSFSTSFDVEGPTTGVGEFSLSGQNNKIKFDFKSGKIFDNEGRYIYSYIDSDRIDISGDADSSKYSYYINDEPFAFGDSRPSFNLQKLCFNTSGLKFSNVKSEVKGSTPNYFLDFPDTFTASGNHTGHLVNDSSLAFRLLGVEMLHPYENSFSVVSFDKDIPANNSGQIVINDYSGISAYSQFRYHLKLHTDFGAFSSGITGTAQPSKIRTVNFNVQKIISEISQTGSSNIYEAGDRKFNMYGVNYSAFSGVTPSGDLKLHVSLEYNSGPTGDFSNGPGGTIPATAPYVTTQFTDKTLGLSGINEIFRSNSFSTGELTGQITGVAFIVGSGSVGENKRVILSGLGNAGVGGETFIQSGYGMASAKIFAYASGTESDSIMSGVSNLSPVVPDSGATIFVATGSGIPMEYYNNTWNYTPGNYIATTGELTGQFSGVNITASDYGEKYYARYITGNIDAITTGDNVTDKWGAFLNNDSIKATDSNFAASGITGTTDHSGLWEGSVLASGFTFYSGTGEYSGVLTGYNKSFTGSYDLVSGQSAEFSFYEHGIGISGAGGGYIWGPHGNIGVGAGAGNVGVYTGYKNEENHILYESSGHASQVIGVAFTAFQDYSPIIATLRIEGLDGNVYTDRITGIR